MRVSSSSSSSSSRAPFLSSWSTTMIILSIYMASIGYYLFQFYNHTATITHFSTSQKDIDEIINDAPRISAIIHPPSSDNNRVGIRHAAATTTTRDEVVDLDNRLATVNQKRNININTGNPLKVHLWDDTTDEKPREEILVQEGWFEYNKNYHSNNTFNDNTMTEPLPLSFVREENPQKADIIVWITTMARHEKEVAPLNYKNKVIVLDYADGQTIHKKHRSLLKSQSEIGYFKRSFIARNFKTGLYKENSTQDTAVLPYAFSGSKAMLIPYNSSEADIKYKALSPKKNKAAHSIIIHNNENNNNNNNGYYQDERYENFLVPYQERKWTITNVLTPSNVESDTRRKEIIQCTKQYVEQQQQQQLAEYDKEEKAAWEAYVKYAKVVDATIMRRNDTISTTITNNNVNNNNDMTSSTPKKDSRRSRKQQQKQRRLRFSRSSITSYIGRVRPGCGGYCFGKNYLRHLRDSQIVVTANPYLYEGDYRLWEAFLSGSLVIVDEMVIPNWLPNPLIDGIHFIQYNPSNQTDFQTKLHYYTTHLEESQQIAQAGYQFVLQYHMPTNRVEYVIDTVKHKLIELVDPHKRYTIGLPPLPRT